MKKYKEFLNEIKIISLLNLNLGSDFMNFYVDNRGCTDKELNDFFKKLEDYLDYEDAVRIKRICLINSQTLWFFSVYESCGNAGVRRTTISFAPSIYSKGTAISDAEIKDFPIFTILEFLDLGLEGIKEEIESREAANKYNL